MPQLYVHMKAFCAKLRLFESQLRNFNVAHFPTLTEIKCAFPNAKLSAKMGECLWSHLSLQNSVSTFEIFLSLRRKSHCGSVFNGCRRSGRESAIRTEMQCHGSLKNQHQAKFPLMRRHVKRMMSLRQPSLWRPSHFNHQTYSWPASYPSDQRAASLLRLSATFFPFLGE